MLLLWAAVLLVIGLRYVGEHGARRFDALPAERARAVHATLSRSVRWSAGVLAVLATIGAVSGAARGATLDACLAGAALLVSLVCVPVLRSAQLTVEQGMTRRGLDPESAVPALPRSRTRTRRVRQFGAVVVAGYLGSVVAFLVSEKTGEAWLDGVGIALFLTAFVAFFALAWTGAWKFADEEKPPSRSQA